jgi:uncharacterized protein (DUF2249 family)
VIRPDDRISAVLARDERLLDVLVSTAPAFARLKNPLMRRTMASLVTVQQAAQIAGLDADALVDRLNRALADGGAAPARPPPQASTSSTAPTSTPVPATLLATPPELLVDLDVREELRAGREPFARIMGAVRDLAPGSVLRLRAIFEPAPLYGVLAKKGLSHFTERIASDDWRVWFFRDAGAPAAPSAPQSAITEGDDVVILDVRDLEPPEPMVRTFEALETLPRGKTLVQLNVRVPQFLLPKLDERGFSYEIHEQSADLVRVFIRHKPT